MGKIAFIDDMPDADKDYILAHRQEILDLAAELGIINVRVGYTGRLVGTVTDDDLYRFAIAFLWLRLAEPATRMLTQRLLDGRAVPAWGLLTNPTTSGYTYGYEHC